MVRSLPRASSFREPSVRHGVGLSHFLGDPTTVVHDDVVSDGTASLERSDRCRRAARYDEAGVSTDTESSGIGVYSGGSCSGASAVGPYIHSVNE
jgi:hypothetical protein